MALGAVAAEIICGLTALMLLISYHVYWVLRASNDRAQGLGVTMRATNGMVKESWVRHFLSQPITTVPLNTLRNYIAILRYSGSSSLIVSAGTAGYLVRA